MKKKNYLTVVMYHQIIKNKKYFHGIRIKEFEKQIIYFKKKFNILNPEEFYYKLKKNKFIHKDCLITFDDGYYSQYKYGLDILNKHNIKAFFFPMVFGMGIFKVHHLNKIQLLIKLTKDKKNILDKILLFTKKENFKTFNNLKKIIKKIETKGFYDDKTDIIIKRLLQSELPKQLREKICDKLFKRLNVDKNILNSMYMNDSHLLKLKSYGHEIGLHTLNHLWLSKLSKSNQFIELTKGLKLLKRKRLVNENWSCCYPFGDYNKDTINILKKLKCTAAFTVKNKPQDINSFKKLEINRLDCNKFNNI
ncbi:polysaccharide deacetylase family protein [Candidatus Pelagibacter sp.]|nr:polysaccharide deacetylase family protein [Candidatus Pelagibacter sp.]MDC0465785.1 polysaccharide deacetylase family protein [Candidatus Pelagibacter sp.]